MFPRVDAKDIKPTLKTFNKIINQLAVLVLV
jgi:hypothetical protein